MFCSHALEVFSFSVRAEIFMNLPWSLEELKTFISREFPSTIKIIWNLIYFTKMMKASVLC